jgi:precorrin-8X/cobalt-precorrin-8 methylmutase
MEYLRDPAAIYRLSFATIAAETAVDRLPGGVAALATRLVHACGMTDLVDDLAFSPDVVEAGRAALAAGAPVLADARMVASGVMADRLPAGNEVLCLLDDPAVPGLAARLGTTRSAAAVELWRPRLEGAVVAIGNAPTALFHLLEAIDAGGPRPAALLAFPVGFVGAAESKAELVRDPRGVPYATVLGRRGGSAMAAAAVNALLVGASA